MFIFWLCPTVLFNGLAVLFGDEFNSAYGDMGLILSSIPVFKSLKPLWNFWDKSMPEAVLDQKYISRTIRDRHLN